MLADDDVPGSTHHLRGVQLVCARLLQHGCHVNSRLVGKGIGTHHRLIPGHGNCRVGLHQLGEVLYLGQIISLQAVMKAQGHQQLLQWGIAAALADAVDCGMQLLGPGFRSGQGVGQSHSQVVMAVHAYGNIDCLLQLADHVIGRARVHDAHCIRHADIIGMILLCLLIQLFQDLKIGARSILCREAHNQAVILGVLYSLQGAGYGLGAAHMQLML